MTLWSSPHPKESAALSLGQAQQGGEVVGKMKDLHPGIPSSATSFNSDGSEDAGFEEGPIDVDMGDEETEGIQIDCIQTLTEFEPIADLRGTDGSPLMSDYKTAIPLPAPPMIGSAYGGNQAYVNVSALPSIMERPTTSPLPYWPASSTDVTRHSGRAPGDVGLKNIGNTCFMNSGLQCLLHTSPLVEFFLASCESLEKSSTSLVYQFHSLMKHAWFGDAGAISLDDFKFVLGNKYAQFKDCRQHDCQEFLAVLLDMLHEELKAKQRAASTAADSSVGESFVEDCTEKDKTADTSSSNKSSPCPSSSQVDENSTPGVAPDNSPDSVNENKIKNSAHKRLKLENGQGDDSETITSASDDLDSCEVKRKSAVAKGESSVSSQPSVTDSNSDVDDGQVDVVNIENEAEGQSQEESSREQKTPISPVEKAQENWEKYMKENNTVIASTFQGMFKSSVTCSECSFISETYEPFMYLSLPIPKVMDKQLSVTFISMKDRSHTKVDLTLHLLETVEKLIQEVVKKVDTCLWDNQTKYVAAEVFNHRVSRVLDEKTQLRNISTNNRNIYVYELNDNFNAKYSLPDAADTTKLEFCAKVTTSGETQTNTSVIEEDWETEDSTQPTPAIASTCTPSTSSYEPLRAPVGGGVYDVASCSTQSTNNFADESLLQLYNDNFNRVQCNICLEDYPRSDLKQHRGCSCVLCEDCLMKSVEHFQSDDGKDQGGSSYVKCAVCLKTVDCKRAFLSLEESTVTSSHEFIIISVIFRNEPGTDANNNSSWNPGLFAYPWLIRVPSYVSASDLTEYIESINPVPNALHRILSVKSDGKSCGQCVFSSRCSGCEIPREGMISLNSGNSILISYTDLSSELQAGMQPPDMIIQNELTSAWHYNKNDEPTIDIHDCLRTFSETEHLDEQNPWFCPQCDKNQRATKALSICKFPDYLIVYLKRFVFLDQSSNKLNNRLTFPINDLDVSDYVTEGFGTDIGKYNLYSCVCHFGSASVGHYTAFAKNPVTNQWHYFNDDSISERVPAETEYASAYVLFYEKQGMRCNIPSKGTRPLPELNSLNTTTTTFSAADTRGSYLPGESSIAPGPVRVDGGDLMNDMNLQVDSSTSVNNYNFPQPSTDNDNNLITGLEEKSQSIENEPNELYDIREGLGLGETDSVCVSSTSAADENRESDFGFYGERSGECETDPLSTTPTTSATATSSTSTQHYELSSSSNTGGADSTSN